MANTFSINLSKSGDAFFSDQGFPVSTQTAVVAVVRWETIPETNSYLIRVEYYASSAARGLGVSNANIWKVENGKVSGIAPTKIAVTIPSQTFNTIANPAALEYIKTQLEGFFGSGSITIT